MKNIPLKKFISLCRDLRMAGNSDSNSSYHYNLRRSLGKDKSEAELRDTLASYFNGLTYRRQQNIMKKFTASGAKIQHFLGQITPKEAPPRKTKVRPPRPRKPKPPRVPSAPRASRRRRAAGPAVINVPTTSTPMNYRIPRPINLNTKLPAKGISRRIRNRMPALESDGDIQMAGGRIIGAGIRRRKKH